MKRAALLLLSAVSLVSAQGLEYIKANYTKYEYQIPMRDGVKLFTAVYAPKDTSQPWPILYDRTPYSVTPYGVGSFKTSLGPSDLFAKDKFIFVYQDVRGKMMSGGTFEEMRPEKNTRQGPRDVDESTDTYDSIDWLIKNVPNNNGKVGIWGISYPGFYTAAGLINAHPALKCASPQAPIADVFMGDDFHHNGALYLPEALAFLSLFGKARPEPTKIMNLRPSIPVPPDEYRFYLDLGPLANVNEKYFKNEVAFWNEITRHPNYDEFWQARNLRPHLKEIKPAVMTVGGWFDAEDLFGALNTYKTIEKSTPGASNTLVMGPWFHGGWERSDGDHLGNVQFGSKTSLYFREKIELPFFQQWLKGRSDVKLPEAYVFETGTNEWRQLDAWPPKNAVAKNLYLRAKGKLSFDAPKASDGGAYDEYVSDPSNPTPYIGGKAPAMPREFMVGDQRFASARTDVLTYSTEPLETDVTAAGPVGPRLRVSTSGSDSDFVVKLIDVYPDGDADPNPNQAGVHTGGYQQLVRGDIMRGRFRDSYEHPEAFAPNQITKVEYSMPDVFHTFRRGHRIMIQVQSSWFPLADRNPQKFVDIYNAKTSDFEKATERVYHTPTAPSLIVINVLQ